MKRKLTLILGTAAVLTTVATTAQAQDDIWKKGRLYYRAVCTTCHEAELGHAVSPAQFTIQEWQDYYVSEAGMEHVEPYLTVEYRESVADTNNVAKAFIPYDVDTLRDYVIAYSTYGAKDSPTPVSCN